ncbi:MAG TPA: T9SS type A sorting domain-containing protein [Bacteroidota bacterium]|nr:T9SS type A sorting domain-containing protein [Bacteroidota bacterium]
MKPFVLALLCLLLPVILVAQTDTVNVPSDQGAGGNLNTAIANVITADPTGAKFSNTVFKLEAGGFYILTGTITTPSHAHFYLVAPAPGSTPATSLPQIVWTTAGGVTTTYNFDCYGDVTMKNIWILCGNTLGSQIGSSMVIEDDTLANTSGKGEHLDMDGCIIDYQSIGNGGGAIEPSCQHFRGHITNTYFRNLTDPHYRYYGRPVSWTYQSTSWHTDTLTFENCTISNVGYAYMQESPEYGDYISFNHVTFLNTMVFSLESNYWWWLSVTNCVFHNIFLYGDTPSQDGAKMIPNGGIITVDSAANLSSLTPPIKFTDSSTTDKALQRHILLSNDSYSHDQWYYDYLAHNAYNDTASAVNKIHVMPALSTKSFQYFIEKDSVTGKKSFPYLTAQNLLPVDTLTTTLNHTDTYSAAYDPGFILAPTNIDSMKAFLMGRWVTGANVGWAYNPQDDYTQVWPLNEDLSYTNNTIMTGAMGGFPLGDLYRWWPSQYTTWAAQANSEHTAIAKLLNDGITTGVKSQTSGLPVAFELSQNYPNPFNPTTKIDYSVPVSGSVSLKVYNILGQEVATLFEGVQRPGTYTAEFDGARLASGVYFYRLQAGATTLTKKLVLMK